MSELAAKHGVRYSWIYRLLAGFRDEGFLGRQATPVAQSGRASAHRQPSSNEHPVLAAAEIKTKRSPGAGLINRQTLIGQSNAQVRGVGRPTTVLNDVRLGSTRHVMRGQRSRPTRERPAGNAGLSRSGQPRILALPTFITVNWRPAYN